MSRILRRLGLALYFIALWFAFDLIYSNFFLTGGLPRDVPIGRADEQFHHGLRPNVEGDYGWGTIRYTIRTNSLGFRDASIRDVPLKSDAYRILLIGDSFTEAVGVEFEESFAGLLARAAIDRPNKIEVLNASVGSYSPAIYYRKIKQLIESGLIVDEVVVLPDVSDIQDEATSYFCIDDDPRYRAYCVSETRPAAQSDFESNLQRHFKITDRTRGMIARAMRTPRGFDVRSAIAQSDIRSGWTIAGYDVGNGYAPLGVEGGVARALQNMQALADLLSSRHIPLTVAVYPWPLQLALEDRNSRQVAIWREFCSRNCKAFIDLFPPFFAEKDEDMQWYERLFIPGDIHFSIAGNQVMFRELAKHLLADPVPNSGAK